MLSTETALDLRYNIAALAIAICSEEFMLPEKAFSVIADKNFQLNYDDVEDMIALLNQGMTYRKIAEIYGSTDSNIFHRVKRYRAKKEKELSDRHLKSSTN
ncbi:helix-turn-helix domain-containing protein [Tissierella praeacuta]|uniref:helix-turn-helix domain-containing protein n=1 Tax=Tissierella praeacuta TaxID=43131 RepID=UPI002FD898C2